MNIFLQKQIEYLLHIQNFREVTNGIFDNFFMLITTFGEIIIPMFVIALIYWCINSKIGTFLLWNWSLGTIFCEVLKSSFCIYRPWILDSQIHPVENAFKMAGGYSFPSGHSQTAVSIWGGIAYCRKHKIITVLALILILLVGFSRNYLGVHTPQDVLIAYILAFFLLFIVDKLMKWEENRENRDIAILASVIIFSLILMLYENLKSYPIDYINGILAVNPADMRMCAFPKIGLTAGAFLGWFLNKRFVKFDGSKGTNKEKATRYIIGMICLLAINKYGTNLLCMFMHKQYSMLIIAFLSTFFLTYLYPLTLTLMKKQ